MKHITDENYLKIKSKLDHDLPLKKMWGLYNMTIVIRSVFHKDDKYYTQIFLDECLHKLATKDTDKFAKYC